MVIKKVDNEIDADICDKLLTKLIDDEKKYNDSIKDNYVVKDYFKNIYTKNNCVLFVAKEKDIIGYIFVKVITSDDGPQIGHEALIDGLYVEEEYRNKKVATSLVEEAIKWCKENKIKYISLHVLDKNLIAKNLYKKLGFDTFYIDLRREV